MNPKDGTDRFTERLKEIYITRCVITLKNAVLSHFTAEVRYQAGLFQMFLKFARNKYTSNLEGFGEI